MPSVETFLDRNYVGSGRDRSGWILELLLYCVPSTLPIPITFSSEYFVSRLALCAAAISTALAGVGLTTSPAWAERDLPAYLRFAGNQCPPWTAEDLRRQEYLTDAIGPGAPPFRYRGDPPIRLDEVGTFIVNGVSYAIPVGHLPGQLDGDEAYEAAVDGDGYRTTGFYGLAFWMPSGRIVERQFGSYHRFCEPGRPPPDPDTYAIGADVLTRGAPQALEIRADRLLWRERVNAALGAPLANVLAGLVPEHSDRLISGIPGAIVYDGLHWHPDVTTWPARPDPLMHFTIFAEVDGLFAVIRCSGPTVVARRGDRSQAAWELCEVQNVGPTDPNSQLPEMRYRIPRRDIGEWAVIYRRIVNMIDGWKVTNG